MKNNNRRITPHVPGKSLAPLALVLVPFLLSPLAAHAQLVAAPAGPGVLAAGNGTPIVNIVAPNAAGVSHNRFTDYNVGAQGVILNNSNAAVKTQLGGMISGNAQLGGAAAKVIINEVIGTNASLLRGTTEVAGQSARLVIANPNGINVRGASFINVPRAVLTTGTLGFDASGNLARIDVVKGRIDIQGLDATNVDEVDVIAKTLAVLDVERGTGRLQMDTNSTPIDLFKNGFGSGRFGSSGRVDSAAVGGMHQGGIALVADAKGVGVNVGDKAKELTGTPAVSAQGLVTVAPSPSPAQLAAGQAEQQRLQAVARQAEQQRLQQALQQAEQQRHQAAQQADQQREHETQVRHQAAQQAAQQRQEATQLRHQAAQQADQQREQATQLRHQAAQQAAQQRDQETQLRRQAAQQADQQREQATQLRRQAAQQAAQQRDQATQLRRQAAQQATQQRRQWM